MRSQKTKSFLCQACCSRPTSCPLPLRPRRLDPSSSCGASAFGASSRRRNSSLATNEKESVPVPEPARIPVPEPARLPVHSSSQAQRRRSQDDRESSLLGLDTIRGNGDWARPLDGTPLPDFSTIPNYKNKNFRLLKQQRLFTEDLYDKILYYWFHNTRKHWINYTFQHYFEAAKGDKKFEPLCVCVKPLRALRPEAKVDSDTIYAEASKSPKAALAWLILLTRLPTIIFRDSPEEPLVYTYYNLLAANLAHRLLSEPEDKRLDLCEDFKLFPWFRIWFYVPFLSIEDVQYCQFGRACIERMINDMGISPLSRTRQFLAQTSSAEAARDFTELTKYHRYPLRNKILGRTSTEEELNYTKIIMAGAEKFYKHLRSGREAVQYQRWEIPPYSLPRYPETLKAKSVRFHSSSANSSSDLPHTTSNTATIEAGEVPDNTRPQFVIKKPKWSIPRPRPNSNTPVTPKIRLVGVNPPSGRPSTILNAHGTKLSGQALNDGVNAPQPTSNPSLTKNPLGGDVFADLWETVIPKRATELPSSRTKSRSPVSSTSNSQPSPENTNDQSQNIKPLRINHTRGVVHEDMVRMLGDLRSDLRKKQAEQRDTNTE